MRSLFTPIASTVTSSSTATPFSPVKPLVAAGLVPGDLSDIFITPKEIRKCIAGARHLTSDEYMQMHRDEKKKEEANELKEQRKAEKEQKKAESSAEEVSS